MNRDTMLSVIMAAVEAELETYTADLTPPELELVSANLKYMAEEMLAMALSQDDPKVEYHQRNIIHYQSLLLRIHPVLRARALNSCTNILARTFAGIAVATGHPLV